MSERLWAINWPSWTYEGISCAAVAFDDVVPFIGKHYPSIFATEPDRFFEEKMTPAKRRFLGECDAFLFRRGDVEAGIAIGHPTDWSTYYVRTMALLPEFREVGFTTEWVIRLGETLRTVGVERMECETSPANAPVHRMCLTTGWIQTGLVNTERWGSMIRYTRYLADEPKRVFHRQFINAPTTRRKNESQSSKGVPR
jgi:hypothetical protein